MSVELLSSYLTSYNTLFLRTQIKSAKSHVQDWRGRCQRGRRPPEMLLPPKSVPSQPLCPCAAGFPKANLDTRPVQAAQGPSLAWQQSPPAKRLPSACDGCPTSGQGNKASHLTIAPVGQHGASKAATHPAAPGRPCVHL